MHLPKHEIPVRMDVPGATVRQLSDFGEASAMLGAEYLTLGAGTDIAPLLVGLEGDLCQSPHWGFLISGALTVSFGVGETEHVTGNELFYWPPGHGVRVEEDAEVVLFSPQDEHLAVIDHMKQRLAAAS
jgi:hypothetical protein